MLPVPMCARCDNGPFCTCVSRGGSTYTTYDLTVLAEPPECIRPVHRHYQLQHFRISVNFSPHATPARLLRLLRFRFRIRFRTAAPPRRRQSRTRRGEVAGIPEVGLALEEGS
jgi:hypothetical protein